MMIPLIIHYCWFGRSPLPKSAQKCIASWQKFFPDYEIKEWNEDNFDINIIPYTKEAYQEKKYAFVSDYVRFWVLYHYGGIYFDTDVEVIRSFEYIIERGAFMGWEQANCNGIPSVAPGLGLAIESNHPFYKECLEGFERLDFFLETGERNPYSMVSMVTDLLMKHGMKRDGSMQKITGITIYPSEYLCPVDPTTGVLDKTANTVSIHWYDSSWVDPHTVSFQLHLLKNRLNRLFGRRFATWINSLNTKR